MTMSDEVIPVTEVHARLKMPADKIHRMLTQGALPVKDGGVLRRHLVAYLMLRDVVTGKHRISDDMLLAILDAAAPIAEVMGYQLVQKTKVVEEKSRKPFWQEERASVPKGCLLMSDVAKRMKLTKEFTRRLWKQGELDEAGRTERMGWVYFSEDHIDAVIKARRERKSKRDADRKKKKKGIAWKFKDYPEAQRAMLHRKPGWLVDCDVKTQIMAGTYRSLNGGWPVSKEHLARWQKEVSKAIAEENEGEVPELVQPSPEAPDAPEEAIPEIDQADEPVACDPPVEPEEGGSETQGGVSDPGGGGEIPSAEELFRGAGGSTDSTWTDPAVALAESREEPAERLSDGVAGLDWDPDPESERQPDD
jgi:hypothetical protein